MATVAALPVAEYLSTSYSPDCDYVDGEVVGRNAGEKPHSRYQTALGSWLYQREKQWGISTFIEQRVQVSRTRFRIPDVCILVNNDPDDRIIRTPPFVCIEILSRQDTIRDMQERIDDYLQFGVRYVWVIDPETRRAFVYTADGIEEVKDGVLRTQNPEIVVPLNEL